MSLLKQLKEEARLKKELDSLNKQEDIYSLRAKVKTKREAVRKQRFEQKHPVRAKIFKGLSNLKADLVAQQKKGKKKKNGLRGRSLLDI